MKRLLKWGCGGLIVLVVLGGILVVAGGNTETTGQKSAGQPSAADTPRPVAPAFAVTFSGVIKSVSEIMGAIRFTLTDIVVE